MLPVPISASEHTALPTMVQQPVPVSDLGEAILSKPLVSSPEEAALPTPPVTDPEEFALPVPEIPAGLLTPELPAVLLAPVLSVAVSQVADFHILCISQ